MNNLYQKIQEVIYPAKKAARSNIKLSSSGLPAKKSQFRFFWIETNVEVGKPLEQDVPEEIQIEQLEVQV